MPLQGEWCKVGVRCSSTLRSSASVVMAVIRDAIVVEAELRDELARHEVAKYLVERWRFAAFFLAATKSGSWNSWTRPKRSLSARSCRASGLVIPSTSCRSEETLFQTLPEAAMNSRMPSRLWGKFATLDLWAPPYNARASMTRAGGLTA